MNKIGEGWQYAVYDLGNGKVLKKFHNTWNACRIMIRTTFPFRNDPPWKIPGYIRQMREVALDSMEVIKKKNIPLALMGNPKFLNGLDLEQDKVASLQEAFEHTDTQGRKKLIDSFIAFNQRLLSMGVIDNSFNILKNFGLDAQGNVILIDIGEVLDDPKKIKEQMRSKIWEKHYVAGYIHDKEAREYFLRRMEETFKPSENRP